MLFPVVGKGCPHIDQATIAQGELEVTEKPRCPKDETNTTVTLSSGASGGPEGVKGSNGGRWPGGGIPLPLLH